MRQGNQIWGFSRKQIRGIYITKKLLQKKNRGEDLPGVGGEKKNREVQDVPKGSRPGREKSRSPERKRGSRRILLWKKKTCKEKGGKTIKGEYSIVEASIRKIKRTHSKEAMASYEKDSRGIFQSGRNNCRLAGIMKLDDGKNLERA